MGRAKCCTVQEAPRPGLLTPCPPSVTAGARPASPSAHLEPWGPVPKPPGHWGPGLGLTWSRLPATDAQETRQEVQSLCRPPQHRIPPLSRC